jgi:hypothetical protein
MDQNVIQCCSLHYWEATFYLASMPESNQLRYETIIDTKEGALSEMPKDVCWIDSRYI